MITSDEDGSGANSPTSTYHRAVTSRRNKKTMMMKQRRLAITTGISLVIMTIVAGFSLGYAYAEFYNPEQLEFLKDSILQNKGLYQGMVIGILIILILDLLVSYTLYKFFEDDNRIMSFIAGAIRVVYTVIFGITSVLNDKKVT